MKKASLGIDAFGARKQAPRRHDGRKTRTDRETDETTRKMVNPGMAVNMAISGFGFYGMLGFAVPQVRDLGCLVDPSSTSTPMIQCAPID